MYEVVYILAIVSIIAYIYYSWYNPKMVYVRSSVDGQIYVVRNIKNKKKAANVLAKVNKILKILVKKFKTKYGTSDERVNLMVKRFANHELRESLPKKNQTSYSLNKGEKIVLCIRSRDDTEKLIDINTIIFVALHEMAHIMTVSIGHKPEFWDNFRFILAHAITWKLYSPVDYKSSPKPYCGIKITDSPLKQNDMKSYL